MLRPMLSILVAATALAALAAPAFADVAPEPCDGKKAGDSCGADGLVCVKVKTELECQNPDDSSDTSGGGCSFGTSAPMTGGLALLVGASVVALSRRRRRA